MQSRCSASWLGVFGRGKSLLIDKIHRFSGSAATGINKHQQFICQSVLNSCRSTCRVSFLSKSNGLVFYSVPYRSLSAMEADPVQQHRQRLYEWFSCLPSEERHFGPSFDLDSIHVDPVIRESSIEDIMRPLSESSFQTQLHTPQCPRSMSVSQMFQVDSSGKDVRSVILYGTVGTGKSTLIRKLVLDWCHERTTDFQLIIPLSCEDLSQVTAPVSLTRLITRKYLHLRDLLPTLSNNSNILFILNSLEWMNVDFRMANTELCSDPNEAMSPPAILVNLLRGYMLPQARVLVTTRPSALKRIPRKYVGRYVEICGFSDTELQKMYFQVRLGHKDADPRETENLAEMLSRNLEHHSQLSAACFLPSYCWLTCATLHLLYYSKPGDPPMTLTGIYTIFLRLNFAGEVLDITHPSK
ncbi:unnamed protein product, partial [Staurois parvus]